jgi:Putative mono-oxygenase ydhR
MLIVRGLKSRLPYEELERRYKERMPKFRDVPGLVQKYYSYDAAAGERAGIYLWDSEASLAAYLESDRRKTIPSAYELVEPPRSSAFPRSTSCEPERTNRAAPGRPAGTGFVARHRLRRELMERPRWPSS